MDFMVEAPRSASSRTIAGSLPPNSRVTPLIVWAAFAMMWRGWNAARESDLAHIRMGGQGVANLLRQSRDDVDRAGRQRLREHCDRPDKRQRTGFRRLEDHAIPGQQGRNNLGEGKHDR